MNMSKKSNLMVHVFIWMEGGGEVLRKLEEFMDGEEGCCGLLRNEKVHEPSQFGLLKHGN